MKTLWQDVRYGLRVLAKTPGFTAVAILTLALGIGATTAIFTVVYGVLLRPLPYAEPERLVQLVESYKDQSEEAGLDMRQFLRLRGYSQLFEHIVGYTGVGYNLATGTGADHLVGMPVSADYFRTLGVQPELGRDFAEEADQGSGQRVAIISHGLWVRRLAGNGAGMGQTILLNGEPFTLIGVMPNSFGAMGDQGAPSSGAPEIWTPLALVAKTAGSGGNISVLARLKPGVTQAQLDAQMNVVTGDLRGEYARGSGVRLSFLSYQRMIGADVRPFLLVLLGAIGFVLLIACANVANLLLARGSGRGREIAIRTALGASSGRIFRQLLTESMLIAMAGGVLGLVMAAGGVELLLALAPIDLPRAQDVHLDVWALSFALLVSLLTGALFGLAPAFEAVRARINEVLKESGDRSAGGRRRGRLRQVLVVGELAMSLVLLTGAGLMIATFTRLLHADPGFNPHPILSMQFWLVGSKYKSSSEVARFYQEVEQRVEAVPGVQAAGMVAAGLPLERGGNNGVRIAGANGSEEYSTDYREVTPRFFLALGIPVREGRVFASSDTETSNRVVIINEAFAHKHFPGRSAVGEHLYLSNRLCEIVGVVGDVKSHLDEPAPSTTFVPAAQAEFQTSGLFEGWFPRSIVVRASVNPLSLSRAVRQAVASVDSTIPTSDTRSMEQVLSHSLALRNFMRMLLSFFAGLALALASVGIYGVISYAVSQRTREIGVRVALGAQPTDVLRLVLSEGFRLVAVGVAIGLAVALALTRLLGGLLYGVSATDPTIFVSVILLLVCIALGACYIPARRATRVDPNVALRYE
jgi:putative ABC transport system permease protein